MNIVFWQVSCELSARQEAKLDNILSTVTEILKVVKVAMRDMCANVPEDVFVTPMDCKEELDNTTRKMLSDAAYLMNVVSIIKTLLTRTFSFKKSYALRFSTETFFSNNDW